VTERICCSVCKKPLISFQGYFLHPDSPCSGITDCIRIEASIEDDFLNEKFIALYGKPRLSDYEMVALQEKHKELLIKKIREQQRILEKPLIKFLRRWLK
jgi:hypothetical protein